MGLIDLEEFKTFYRPRCRLDARGTQWVRAVRSNRPVNRNEGTRADQMKTILPPRPFMIMSKWRKYRKARLAHHDYQSVTGARWYADCWFFLTSDLISPGDVSEHFS